MVSTNWTLDGFELFGLSLIASTYFYFEWILCAKVAPPTLDIEPKLENNRNFTLS
jgi:hypothetical protein